MKPLLLYLFLAFVSSTFAAHVGFSVSWKDVNGNIKNEAAFTEEFKKIKEWGGNSARLFSSSEGVLSAAAPAAKTAGITLIAGLWIAPEKPEHFENEKQALLNVIREHGSRMLAGISVGSENLYRKDTDVQTIIKYVYDVRQEVRALGADTWVGVTDTWTAWTSPENYDLIEACDMLITDAYPFWQGVDVADGKNVLYSAFEATKEASKQGTKSHPIPRHVWIGETGWPTEGPSNRSAVPSIENASQYYKSTWCSLIKDNIDFYWYTSHDLPYRDGVEASFGIADANWKPKYTLGC